MADPNDPQTPPNSQAGAEAYDASKIQKLEGLEGVRKRPDMYIGDTNERGLHHCVFEVVDNSVDEALAGFATAIKVTIHLDGSCSVEDDGRGIPVDPHPVYKIPALELVLTNLHAGGKFGKGAYQVSGGLHGVGAKCVNAVSEWFEAEVRRGGKVYQMRFAQGKTTQKMMVIGDTQEDRHEDHLQARPGDLPDDARIPVRDPGASACASWRSSIPGSRSSSTDERSQKGDVLLLQGRHHGVRPVPEPEQERPPRQADHLLGLGRRTRTRPRPATVVDVSMQYNDSYNDQVFAYANSIYNLEGGTHLSGFRTALTRVDQQVRQGQQPPQGEGPGDHGRRRARGPRRRHLGQGPRAPVRGPDQDQALQLRGGRDRPEGRRARSSSSSSSPTRRSPSGSSTRRSTPRAPARRRARPARPSARARSPAAACPASSPTAPSATRRSASSTSSRATRPAARPSRAATAATRRSCPCAAS